MNRPTGRRAIILSALVAIAAVSHAQAGIGHFWEVGYGITASAPACQFRFNALGTLDDLTIDVTLRNDFGTPEPGHEISMAFGPNNGTEAFCECESHRQTAITDGDGVCTFYFAPRLGGRGSLAINVSLHDGPAMGQVLRVTDIPFTSPDLDGSCEPSPASAVGVIDLGIWASALPPDYLRTADFDCDGTVGTIDLGILAMSLGWGCP